MVLSVFLVKNAELRGDAPASARGQYQTAHDTGTPAKRRDRQKQSAGTDQAETLAPTAHGTRDGAGELTFDAGCAGTLAEHSAQQITHGGPRTGCGLEHVRLVGPCEAASVSAATVEEFFVAAAGKRIIV